MSELTQSPAWQALLTHQKTLENAHMRDLFADDPKRFDRFHLKHDALLLDYSKNRITEDSMRLLFDLLRAQDFEKWRDDMFAGARINTSENRAVQHTAMRNGANKELPRMYQISEDIRDGRWTGHSGRNITDIVNIGIGGQHFGVHTAYHALSKYRTPDIRGHFVSNIDASDITELFNACDPETTLFLISSKSFTTQETLANANTARQWIMDRFEDEAAIAKHFIALSNYPDKAKNFGIPSENVLEFEDSVGGRFSSWSCSSLILTICLGKDHYKDWLAGAHSMDQHFQTAPVEENIPAILALLSIWYRNFWNIDAFAISPYSHYLRYFVEWIQQVDMESQGKQVDRSGSPIIDYQTGAVMFGIVGTNAQHAFIQLVHQGTTIIPTDFMAPIKPSDEISDHHEKLLSNFLAQTEALMLGRHHDDPNKVFTGNRPSNSILIDELSPYTLGMLMAMYEHKIFVQGIVWNINSFDQFGVELGKEMADTLLDEIKSKKPGAHDSSTTALLKAVTS